MVGIEQQSRSTHNRNNNNKTDNHRLIGEHESQIKGKPLNLTSSTRERKAHTTRDPKQVQRSTYIDCWHQHKASKVSVSNQTAGVMLVTRSRRSPWLGDVIAPFADQANYLSMSELRGSRKLHFHEAKNSYPLKTLCLFDTVVAWARSP